MQQLWGANEDSSQRIGEPGRAGPDRSVTCQGGGGEDGEDGRAGRDKERGGGRHTQAGGGGDDGRVAAGAASSARAAATAASERRSARRAAVRRTQSPPAATPTADSLARSSFAALSGVRRSVGAGNECESTTGKEKSVRDDQDH